MNPVPDSSSPGPAVGDDAGARQALIGKLRDDRQDLVRVAGTARELAETLEAAQGSLAILRRTLRWMMLVGGVAALTWSMRSRRRPPALLLGGVSLYLVRRWLAASPPRRRAIAPASSARPGAA